LARSKTIPTLLLVIPLTLSPLSAVAQEAAANTLAAHIPQGLWEFAYQRSGRFKPLFWKYKEEGKSDTCIRSDPRLHLLDWIARKGCSVSSERPLPDGYLLSGECRLKWVPGQPVPVDVRLTWRGERRFDMDIRSREHAILSYTESTRATLLGPCPGQ
jgi:hypothetical protein